MMTRKENLEDTSFVTEEERYKRLIRLISSRLNRDLGISRSNSRNLQYSSTRVL